MPHMRGKWMLAAVPVALAVGCGSSAGSSSTSTSDGGTAVFKDSKSNQDSAYEACKHFVGEQLKSPASASYPNFFTNTADLHIAYNGAGSYTVSSQVDSDNSFGAKLRTLFTCTTSTADGGNNWSDDGTTLTPQ